MKPNVSITRQAIKTQVEEVLLRPKIETGWALYGLIKPNGRIIITNILQPNDSDIDRQTSKVIIGGEVLADAYRWLAMNYAFMKRDRGITDSSRLAFLFKGHSHHTLTTKRHSPDDIASIREAIEVDHMEVAIGPLATIELNTLQRILWFLEPANPKVNLQYLFLSQAMINAGNRDPIPIVPNVIDETDVHLVPQLCWRFTERDLYEKEIAELIKHGCKTQVVYRDIDGKPPLEIQFLVQKPNWAGVVSIVTAWDYPLSDPVFVVTRIPGRFPRQHILGGDLYPSWSKGDHFIDAIKRLEGRGAI